MPQRTMCEALQEMRKAYDTRNFSYLLGLIEEVQHMGNRMEAGLGEKGNVEYYHEQAKKERLKVDALEKKKTNLENRIAQLNLVLPPEEQEELDKKDD